MASVAFLRSLRRREIHTASISAYKSISANGKTSLIGKLGYLARPFCSRLVGNDIIQGDKNVGDKPFLMPVQDVFSISENEGSILNPEAVACGRIAQGTIKIGEEVEILDHNYCDSQRPSSELTPLKTTVSRVHVSKKTVDSGKAGETVGLRLDGLKKEEIQPGMVIAKPGSLKMYKKFEAEIHMLKKENREVENAYYEKHMPLFCLDTSDFEENLVNLTPGGDSVTTKFELSMHIPLATGHKFAFKEGGRIVGCGVVSKVIPY